MISSDEKTTKRIFNKEAMNNEGEKPVEILIKLIMFVITYKLMMISLQY